MVSMSASFDFWCPMYLIWIYGFQIDSVEQPIKGHSVGSGNMCHCRASSLDDNLDRCFGVSSNTYNKAS